VGPDGWPGTPCGGTGTGRSQQGRRHHVPLSTGLVAPRTASTSRAILPAARPGSGGQRRRSAGCSVSSRPAAYPGAAGQTTGPAHGGMAGPAGVPTRAGTPAIRTAPDTEGGSAGGADRHWRHDPQSEHTPTPIPRVCGPGRPGPRLVTGRLDDGQQPVGTGMVLGWGQGRPARYRRPAPGTGPIGGLPPVTVPGRGAPPGGGVPSAPLPPARSACGPPRRTPERRSAGASSLTRALAAGQAPSVEVASRSHPEPMTPGKPRRGTRGERSVIHWSTSMCRPATAMLRLGLRAT